MRTGVTVGQRISAGMVGDALYESIMVPAIADWLGQEAGRVNTEQLSSTQFRLTVGENEFLVTIS